MPNKKHYYCSYCHKKHSENYKKHWKYRAISKLKKSSSLEDCTKQDLLKRIKEVLTRGFGKMPNEVIDWDWERYRIWLLQPLLVLNFDPYDDSHEI